LTSTAELLISVTVSSTHLKNVASNFPFCENYYIQQAYMYAIQTTYPSYLLSLLTIDHNIAVRKTWKIQTVPKCLITTYATLFAVSIELLASASRAITGQPSNSFIVNRVVETIRHLTSSEDKSRKCGTSFAFHHKDTNQWLPDSIYSYRHHSDPVQSEKG